MTRHRTIASTVGRTFVVLECGREIEKVGGDDLVVGLEIEVGDGVEVMGPAMEA